MDGMIGSLKEALHTMIENSELPAKALAEALDINYSMLMNAANPNLPEFRFQARHLIPLTRLTGSFAAIDHIENSLGRVAFSIPKTNDSDTKTIQDDLLETISDFGKLVQDTSETLLPGHMRADEVKRLESDAFQLMRDLAHFIDDLKKPYAHRHPAGQE